jgi:hypothetical protein
METRSTLDRHASEVLAEVYALLARRGRELRAAEDDQPIALEKVVRRRRTKTPQGGE